MLMLLSCHAIDVDVGSVEDWHMRRLDLGGIDLNTRNLEIFSNKQTFSAG